MHVKFDKSQTIWKRIEVPLPNGGCLRFDLPEGVGRDAFGDVYKQAIGELNERYLRTHQLPDWEVFANDVQSRIDSLVT